MKLIPAIFLCLLVTHCSSPKKMTIREELPHTLEEAIASSERSPEFVKRDQYRHPLETLKFFGVQPEMTIIEILPSGGWYTEILAPFLHEKGTYVIAEPHADPNGYTKPRVAWMKHHPKIAEKVKYVTFDSGSQIDLGPDQSADMVLTFRNVHNWLPVKKQEEAFKKFFRVLKPGGVLGVVDHRANPKVKFDVKSGYVLEKEIIRIGKKAGFVLEAKSEINANPRDTTQHPEGVWTLPPRLRLGEKDKDKYLAIGESDRMTLRFVKPKK